MGNIYRTLSTGIEQTRSVDAILEEYIRQELASDRAEYPNFDDSAWDALTKGCFHFKHFYRFETKFLALERHNDSVHMVKEGVTDTEKQQAVAIREKAMGVYKDAVIKFAAFMREFNLR